MKYRVTLNNSAGELDARVVQARSEEVLAKNAREAALELINSVPFLYPGDTIKVEEIDA